MKRTHMLLNALFVIAALAASLPVRAADAPHAGKLTAVVTPAAQPSLMWNDRGDIAALNLLYGPGGKERQPSGKFTFVSEDLNGTAAKFNVIDEHGVAWKVKLGEETKSETAATRLVWAAGYFADEDYFLPELRVENLPRLHRGRQYVSAGGIVRNVRMERKIEGQKKSGNWSWYKNPLTGTKEFNGLRVMMALVNDWDLKEINNAIYEEKGEQPRYVISDMGATFGRTGNSLNRSKSNLRDYRKSHFVQKVNTEQVDFYLSSRPFFVSAINVPNYAKRTKMQSVAKDIPRTHAKWLGQMLGQLSPEQIRDCFRAAGYSPEEVEGFAVVVQSRIADLNKL